MATTDATVMAHHGLGDRGLGRARPASFGADGWDGWFGPAQGLRPRLADVLLVVATAFFQIAGTIAYSRDEPPSPWAFDALACLPLAAGPVALLFRRRWPEATLVVTFAAAAGYAATGYPRGPAGFPAFMVALVSAIMMGRRTFAWRVLAVAYATFTLLPALIPDDREEANFTPLDAADMAWMPLVAASSEIARIRVERRAERAHAEREEARRRTSEERLLIARELHDVLAHNISLINVRSGVALHLLDERPEQARPALEAINEASEEALGELRSVLDVLSRGLGPGPGLALAPSEDRPHGESGAWAPRAPTAGLRDLDGLVRRTRAAGLDVDLAVGGDARPMPAGVDLAAFRIVQEALTNIVRHAGGDARATVRLVYGSAELIIQVDDDGRGAPPPAGESPTADGSDGSTTADTPSVPDGSTTAGTPGDSDGSTTAGSPGESLDTDGVGGSGGSPTMSDPGRSLDSGGSGRPGGSTTAGSPGRSLDADGTGGSGGSTTVGEGGGGSRGIAGMRERVNALGGTFAAGPRPGRGFRVRAQFPLPARRDDPGQGMRPAAGGAGPEEER